jgi:hypothetical protein
MIYPQFKDYVRFYKYAGTMKMVKIRNPITNPYAYFYVEDENYGILCVSTRGINSYYPYGYSDWAQINRPPDYITKFQQFKWYYEKWKKNK